MAVEQVHHHRPTLKQTNKPFKSKHASKSSVKKQAKGRISRQSPKAGHAQSDAAQLRMNRKNAAKQAQLRKREALVSATRIFNGVDGAPRIVAVVPLCEDVSSRIAGTTLSQSLDPDAEAGPEFGLRKLKADRFKTSLQFIHLPYRHLYAALDACKVADYVVFVLSSSIEVDAWGDMLLRALQAQGLPHVVACVASGLPSEDKKTRTGIVKSLLSFMQYFVPSLSRVFDLASSSDCANALRSLCEGHPADVRWRSGRPYLLAEDVRWEVGEDTNGGHLHVTGIVRGAPLSANRLVHIPNHGDYQVEKIMSAPLPRSGRGAGMEIEPSLLAEPDSENADSLISTNVPDDLANEQTWPTEEEMQGAEPGNEEQLPDAHRGTTPRRVKRVPKGWSEYQAAWIVDSEDEEGGEDDEDEQSVDEDSGKDGDVGMKGESETRGAADKEDEEEMVDLPEADMETSTHKSVHFQDLDIEEETRQLGAWRSRDRAKEEAEDAAFPDELDTPQDIPARVRFQRYRGLRSFRTSPWDAYENLPRDYARIFQFEDFRRTERNVRKRMEAEGYGIEPGTRVTLMLKNVPEDAAKVDPSRPFVLFGLLQHEHKITVLNFAVQRNTEYDAPVRSKDPLILCYGPRRLRTNPTYSQHTRGGGKGVNNVHKFERWLRHGETSVATTFGPIVFGNQPCMLLRETGDPQAPELVAMGSFLNTDTTRIVAKRIILTGHPFKVHRKTATVRYMFFNPEDVAYFAPVQLHTKYGRTGHIKDSLGTHGYFKAHFDGPINQMDTVCMSLYKRVYPRWPTTFRQDGSVQGDDVDDSADAMEE